MRYKEPGAPTMLPAPRGEAQLQGKAGLPLTGTPVTWILLPPTGLDTWAKEGQTCSRGTAGQNLLQPAPSPWPEEAVLPQGPKSVPLAKGGH